MMVDLALELHVEVEEFEPFAARFGAGERHRPERGRRGVLEGALQARLVALEQQLRRLEVGRQAPDRRCGAVRLGRDAVAPLVPPGDVVRVDERDRRAPRLGAALLGEPLVELARDLRGPRASPGRGRRRARGRRRPRSRSRSSARFARALASSCCRGGSDATCRTSACGSRVRAASSPRSESRGRACCRR